MALIRHRKAGPLTIRCSVCGRFIGFAEFRRNRVGTRFTPDSHFTAEIMEFWHRKCDKQRTAKEGA